MTATTHKEVVNVPMEPTLLPARTRGSSRLSNSAFTTPCRQKNAGAETRVRWVSHFLGCEMARGGQNAVPAD